MEVRISELPQIADAEFCVIGTGPAGLTCALALAAAGRKVFLAEGGGEQFSEDSQDLYRGEVIGDPYFALDACRLRFFGGTSNHWNGWCRRLDDIDFQGKGPERIGHWPITRNDLEPFFDRAASILEISTSSEDSELKNSGLKLISFTFSPPVRFNEKYLDQVRRNKNIRLCLNCNFVNFENSGGSIQAAVFANASGSPTKLSAKTYILCAGGIENSRLLAWSNVLANGELLRGSAQQLGTRWSDHPHFAMGEAIINTEWNFRSGYNGMQFFAPIPRFMAENDTLNCGLRLGVNPDKNEARKLVQDLMGAAPGISDWVCSNFEKGTLCAAKLRAAWEQEPRVQNRVALSSKKDRFGIPTVKLYWTKTHRDLLTARKTAEALGLYLAQNNFGRLRLDDWVLRGDRWPENDWIAGYHHLGGTRMGIEPDDAVVDKNLRLFHCSNAYILGSSVFPSGGHANPTLTIVQLALRLAEHLVSL